MFKQTFTQSALEDLQYFKKFEQVLILDAIEQQLLTEPMTETRNRKPLRTSLLSQWELRVQKYRVFYDVDLKQRWVKIKTIGWKDHNHLFIRNQEYDL